MAVAIKVAGGGIAADVVRLEDGLLKEHWDVLQDEATQSRIRQWPAHVRRQILGLTGDPTIATNGGIVKLSGNTVFITGGGLGIGRALAEQLLYGDVSSGTCLSGRQQ